MASPGWERGPRGRGRRGRGGQRHRDLEASGPRRGLGEPWGAFLSDAVSRMAGLEGSAQPLWLNTVGVLGWPPSQHPFPGPTLGPIQRPSFLSESGVERSPGLPSTDASPVGLGRRSGRGSSALLPARPFLRRHLAEPTRLPSPARGGCGRGGVSGGNLSGLRRAQPPGRALVGPVQGRLEPVLPSGRPRAVQRTEARERPQWPRATPFLLVGPGVAGLGLNRGETEAGRSCLYSTSSQAQRALHTLSTP